MSSGFQDSFEKRENELQLERDRKRQLEKTVNEKPAKRGEHLFRLGRQPVHLSMVEFRIISFLSRKPYRAFSRAAIVAAVTSKAMPVTDETLDEHIRTLRGKLGLLSDYIQTVPYIGYRFKP